MTKVEFARVKNAFWTHEARQFRSLAAQVQAYVNRNPVIIEKHGMEVGHVAAVFEAENSTHCRCRAGNFVPSQSRHHPADQMDHQIAGNAGTIRSPAAPPREV